MAEEAPPGSGASNFSKGDLVWFDQGEYPIPAEVIEIDNEARTAKLRPSIVGAEDVITANYAQLQSRFFPDPKLSTADDLVQISDLSDGNLLWTLKNRFEQGNIYTYIGGILLSINPGKTNALVAYYGTDVIQRYCNRILGALPPHIFAIAEAAYSKMRSSAHDQVMLPNGESGSGKTEIWKHLLRYLTSAAPCSRGRPEPGRKNISIDQILAAVPILESFGNAATLLNDNSTRCAITIDLAFRQGTICSAEYAEYVLEKTRVASLNNGERNFHVFYELLAGLKPELKDKFGLSNAEKYFYLNQGKNIDLPTRNDKESFRALQSAFDTLGLGTDQKHSIFRILAAILHIGNVYFNRQQNQQHQESVSIGNEPEVQWISYLLQLDPDSLKVLLTTKNVENREERASAPLNIDKALDVRDAISKALYTQLFSWLINRINQCVRKSGKEASIILVDTFGFEVMKTNSFEQLCINYANERLQAYFVESVFRTEQTEYNREKIAWQEKIGNQLNNQPILDLFSRRPSGIFHLLDDECSFPKGTDESFLQKCHYSHVDNSLYGKPRMHNPEFCIKHYAGPVWYDASGFLDKNRDVLKSNVVDILIESQNSMISQMFKNWKNAQQATVKPKLPSAMATFADGLNQLMKKLVKADPHFIRCISSNLDKVDGKFDPAVVLRQMKTLGIAETVRIRKLGYPIRFKFSNFLARYRCLVPKDCLENTEESESCNRLLSAVAPNLLHMCQIGTTKIFMKDMLCDVLEHERERSLQTAAIKIQKHARAFVAKKRYKKMRTSATKIQAIVRGWIARNDYRRLKTAVLRDAEQQAKRSRQLQVYEKMRKEAAAVDDPCDDRRNKHFAITGVHHLDLPHDLAVILENMPEWDRRNRRERVARAALSDVALLPNYDSRYTLPPDLHAYPFTKFVQAKFKSHIWQMRREPVATPFLPKENDMDFQDSLVLFKLILRYMNDISLTFTQEVMMANFIVQKGLGKPVLRDEIYAQLVNQTYANPNAANQERGWWLIGLCASAFPPSPSMYKYVLNYVVNSDCNGYKQLLQNRLCQSAHAESAITRRYPPCLVEHKATMEKAKMGLDANVADGSTSRCQIESWTMASEFAQTVLKEKGVDETRGWTVSFVSPEVDIRLNGSDYILDVISYFELPNTFPALKSEFLVAPRSSASKYGTWTKAEQSHKNGHSEAKKREETMPREQAEKNTTTGSELEKTPVMTSSGLNKRYKDNGRPDRMDNISARPGQTRTAKNADPPQTNRIQQRNQEDHSSNSSSPVSDPTQYPISPNRHPAPGLSHQQSSSVVKTDQNSRIGQNSEPRVIPIQREQPSFQQQLEMEIRNRNLGSGAQQRQHPQANDRPRNQIDDSSDHRSSPNLVVAKPGPDAATVPKMYQEQRQTTGRGDTEDHSQKYVGPYGIRKVMDQESNSSRNPRRDIPDVVLPPSSNIRTEMATANAGQFNPRIAPSEYSARSMASHVRNVAIPSKNSDVDKFLDELFDPVLHDSTMDDIYDLRSIAASIKGGGDNASTLTRTSVNRGPTLMAAPQQGPAMMLTTAQMMPQMMNQPVIMMMPMDSMRMFNMCSNMQPSEGQFTIPNVDWSSVTNQNQLQSQHRYPAIAMDDSASSVSRTNTLSSSYQQHSRNAYVQNHNNNAHYQQQLQLSPVQSSATVYAPAMLSPTPSTITAITAPTMPVMPLQVSTFVPMSMAALASPVLAVQQPMLPVQYSSGPSQQRQNSATMLSPTGVPPEPSYPAPTAPIPPKPSTQAPDPPAVVHIPPDRTHPMARHQQASTNGQQKTIKIGQAPNFRYQDDYNSQHNSDAQYAHEQVLKRQHEKPIQHLQVHQQRNNMSAGHYGQSPAYGNSTLTVGSTTTAADEYDDYDDESMISGGTMSATMSTMSYGVDGRASAGRRSYNRMFNRSGPPTTITEEASDAESFDRHGNSLLVGKMKPTSNNARYVGSVQIGGQPQLISDQHLQSSDRQSHTIRDIAKAAREGRVSPPEANDPQQAGIPAAVLPSSGTGPRAQFSQYETYQHQGIPSAVSPPGHRIPIFRNDEKQRQEAVALEKMKINAKNLPPPVDEVKLIRHRSKGKEQQSISQNRYSDQRRSQSQDRAYQAGQSRDYQENRHSDQRQAYHQEQRQSYHHKDHHQSYHEEAKAYQKEHQHYHQSSKQHHQQLSPSSDHKSGIKRSEEPLVHQRMQQLEAKKREAMAKAEQLQLRQQQLEAYSAAEREWTARAKSSKQDEFDYDDQNRGGPFLHQHGDEFDRYAFSKIGYAHQSGGAAAVGSKKREKAGPKEVELGRGGEMEEDKFGDWVHENVNTPVYREDDHVYRPGGRNYGYDPDEDEIVGNAEESPKQRRTDSQSAVNDTPIWKGAPPDPAKKLEITKSAKDPRRRGPLYTYEDAPWSFRLQKELFYPNETLDNQETLDLVFYQIVRDVYDWNPFRIRKHEREQMLATFRYYDIDPQTMKSSTRLTISIKRSIVDTARTWPLYFCRFYHIVEDRKSEYVAQLLCISETGIRLVVRTYNNPEEPLKMLDHFEYEDIDRVEIPEKNLLAIVTFNKLHLRLFTERTESIKALIDEYLYGPNQGKQYVRGCADYITKEPNLLSFRKGDIIQLVTNMQENYMGSGWLYGKFNNRYGNFPCNYVESFSGDSQINSDNHQFADSNMPLCHDALVATMQTMAGNGVMFDDPIMTEAMMMANGSMPRSGKGKITMMEFAMQYYKHAPSGGKTEDGEMKTPKKSKKEWTWKEFADMVKFSKSPIQSSLLKLDKGELNKLAVECFISIMSYMGDYPLKKDSTVVDCVYKLLMTCHHHPQMRDEVYCQVVKQTTNNKSSKPDSAILGWRLFSILTAYFDCSDVLKPYLIKYLSEAANDTRRAYHGTATICLQNIAQTFKYGGRKYLLSAREIESMTNGKNLKRQVYHLPGGTKKVVNTKSVTVVEEVIQELCQELNIRSPLEQQEFCLCYVVEADNTMKLMANDEYILDVTTELEFKRKDYFLLLKRTVWIHPLRLDNDLYIDVMFFQVVPDYLEGLLVVMRSPETISASFMDDIALLGALLHCADDHWDGQYVNSRSVSQLLPRIVQNLRHINLEQWAERVNAKLRQISPKITTTQARAKFLEVLQTWTLFGSTFFYILNMNDPRIQGECLMSINKHGVQFLHMITHETLLEFRLNEILSTHKVNAAHPAGGAPIQLLDMKMGNLLQQRVLSLQTDQSAEISRLLGQYIYVDSQNRGYINGNQNGGADMGNGAIA